MKLKIFFIILQLIGLAVIIWGLKVVTLTYDFRQAMQLFFTGSIILRLEKLHESLLLLYYNFFGYPEYNFKNDDEDNNDLI